MVDGRITVTDTRDGWEVATATFRLPDGQSVQVLARLCRTEHKAACWELTAWEVDDDSISHRRVANFEIPLDTSVYPA